MLYTAGVGSHHSKRLKYHNALSHLFLLVAAVCHSLAVLALVSDRGGG
jgi:predicted membrane channel-forming protein YqfA (hemolysin III family)